MLETIKDDKVATTREAHFYARMVAAIDFLNDVDADLWRQHVMRQHGAGWPWHQPGNQEVREDDSREDR